MIELLTIKEISNGSVPWHTILRDIVQSIFFIITATIAIFTYLSAKRGFLSSVNTEYKKKVIERLELLSNLLYEEFEVDSENHWTKVNVNTEAPLILFNAYNSTGEIDPGIPETSLTSRLEKIKNKILSDPFLPDEIVEPITTYLNNRINKTRSIIFSECDKYKKELKGELYKNNYLEDSPYIVANRINSLLYENGFGVSDVEKSVHDFRLQIRNYLKSFDPLKKSK